MKKFFAILLAGMVSATCVMAEEVQTERQQLQKQSTEAVKTAEKEQMDKNARTLYYTGKVIYYIPNLLLDLSDVFSLNLKAGPSVGAGFGITKAFGLGVQVGTTIGVYKDVNRQYGFASENGYQAQFGFLTVEDISVVDPIGTVQGYWQFGNNFPSCYDGIYNIENGARDYWALDVYVSALFGVDFGLHPIEIADFVTGIFFYDLKNDDIKKVQFF